MGRVWSAFLIRSRVSGKEKVEDVSEVSLEIFVAETVTVD
jgi:hypothetical protein